MVENRIKYHGVVFIKDRCKFLSTITVDRKPKLLGLFAIELDAALAYDSYVRENKLDRRLNFPDPEPENLIPNTRLIRLNKGEFAIVDEEDFEMLNKHLWYLSIQGNNKYAQRRINIGGKITNCTMHVFLCRKEGFIIDHINRNGLHNYKSNFRYCNYSENTTNRVKKAKGSSNYYGVYYSKRESIFRSCITKNGKFYDLGKFTSEIDAAVAHDVKAKELHGEFASLNFPES